MHPMKKKKKVQFRRSFLWSKLSVASSIISNHLNLKGVKMELSAIKVCRHILGTLYMIMCTHIFGINNKIKFRHSVVIFAKGRPFPESGTYILVTGLPQAPCECGGRSVCVWRAPLTLCSCCAPLRIKEHFLSDVPAGTT